MCKNLYLCPNCNQNTFTCWDKINMSPKFPKVCKVCSIKIEPVAWAMVLGLTMMIFISILLSVIIWYMLSDFDFAHKYISILIAMVIGMSIPIPFWLKLNAKYLPLKIVNEKED